LTNLNTPELRLGGVSIYPSPRERNRPGQPKGRPGLLFVHHIHFNARLSRKALPSVMEGHGEVFCIGS